MLKVAGSVRPPLISADSGPGRRWLLFLQGCQRPCTTDCLNPRLLDPRGGVAVARADILLLIDQLVVGTWGPVAGVTVLGGEPTDQAPELEPVLAHAAQCGLSVMLYSGHRMEWFSMPGNEAPARLLAHTDILVDGPFVPALADSKLVWRGSSNQRILLLSPRHREEELSRFMSERGFTATLVPDGRLIMSGLQDREVAERTEAILDQLGPTAESTVTR